MSKNSNLHGAKKAKNDEFYTQLSDIENELKHYKDHFKGKIVLCNCDDPKESMFWRYFALNFGYLGLKKLIAIHYETDVPSYKLELEHDITGDGIINEDDTIKTSLKGNGDFRSPESIDMLKECDIVVTNPPFSLFREFIALLEEYDKKYLVIGNKNAINNKDMFPLIKNNKLWLGNTSPNDFRQPEGVEKKNLKGLTYWFTNLTHNKRNEKLILYKEYNEIDYPKYDNYNAIEVSKTKDIPINYEGVMGVPISFLDKYNPEQFEILGLFCDTRNGTNAIINGLPTYVDDNHKNYVGGVIQGKSVYSRILIKNKQL